MLNVPEAHKYMRDNRVSIVHMTPMLISEFNKYSWSDSIRTFIVGGEKVLTKHVKPLYNLDCEIYQGYGPTENTVIACLYQIRKAGDNTVPADDWDIPIGYPKRNTKIYIVSGDKLCGIGVPGELCIGGESLADGYLNLPELTAEKFVKNPFGEGRMYHSGDLARWLPDGNIEFLGRIDEQVKIKGIRIELGEIESRLRAIEKIRDCAVIAREDSAGEKAIYAYYISDENISVSEIREILSGSLPDYMMPSYMMQVDEFAVNRSGKLDKRALPDITAKASNQYIAPETAAQAVVCELFGEILGIEKVGIKDSFFDLGGHSLRATRLINMLEEKTGVKLALKDIFISTTPEQIAEIINSRAGEIYEAIPKAAEKEYYPMTSTQKRTYYIQQMEPQSTAYNMPFGMILKGEVYPDKLHSALRAMVDRHEILRTAFLDVNGEPVQKILDYAEPEFEYIASDKSDDELTSEYLRPFDLSKPPFIRLRLVNKGDYHLMVLDMHHIVSDGMSETIFVDELTRLYVGETLEPVRCQFKDYSEWLNSRDLSGQADYWKKQFSEEAPVLDMPLDYARPQIQSFEGAVRKLALDATAAEKIRTLSEKTGATEYMIFLAALMITLSKYSRQEDIVIGSPISERTHRDTEKMLGMFINTLAMRGRPERNKTVAEFLNEIKNICLNAYENQEYPFEELVESVTVYRDMSRNPLFDVMLVFQNNESAKVSVDESLMSGVAFESGVYKFDMTFNIQPADVGYIIFVEYGTRLFKEETIDRVLTHFREVVYSICDNIEQHISDVEMIVPTEKEKILTEFNSTTLEYPKDKTIVELFEEQAAKTPDKTAVVYNERSLTYSELNGRANTVAYKLREIGIKPDDFVAVIADRSLEMLYAIYGVLKAGGAYVPIDPAYPQERITYMLTDCMPKAVITFTETDTEVPNDIPVADLHDDMFGVSTLENPEHVNKSNDLAYCIYTSGTTGKPKGVAVEHYGVANLREYFMKIQGVNENDRVLQFASIAFDATVSEMTMGLLTGACMYVISPEIQQDTHLFETYTAENQISIAILPPAYLSQVNLKGFRTIITAGSETNSKLVQANNHIEVYSNDYGPTETTVCATYWKHNNYEPVPDRIPIGKPMNNKQIYIMNGNNLCGIGVPGEICIAGEGIARGYLNRPELTAEKFVKNPFGEGRMYRSGDLARWLPDGNIEYLGRIDEQVKIRGFRIELGEIESRIREIDNITDCAVIAKNDSSGERAIYAYYVSDSEISVSKVRDRLIEVLPNYMIPSYMMQIESIPVTRNGKLDKKALPDIEFDRQSECVPPENELQKMLCDIMGEVLKIDQFGITDDFFEYGGDSIKAIKVVSLLRNNGYEIAVRDIMQNHTVAILQNMLTVSGSKLQYEQGEVSGELPNTPIIDEFISWNLDYANYFNHSMCLPIDDSIDESVLKTAFTEIVTHHDMLRAVMKAGKVKILPVSESKLFELYTIDLSDFDEPYAALEQRCNEIQASMNLPEGPLVKVLSFKAEGQKYIAVFVHHLVIDGVSWRIIQDDFKTIVSQLASGEEVRLPEKTASYIDWSKALKEFENSEEFEEVRTYWGEQLETLTENTFGTSNGTDETAESRTVTVEFDEEETALIKKSVTAFNSNLLDIFISAFAAAAEEVTGNSSVTIMIEDNGRRELPNEILIDRTVGWFTNTYPIVAEKCEDWEETVIRNKETLRNVPYNGLGFMRVNNGTANTKEFVLLNYLGEFGSENSSEADDSGISLGKSFADDRTHIDNDIAVNGAIGNGQLSFSVSYNSGKLSDSDINDLCGYFRKYLLELAEYCDGYGSTMYTASDFSDDLDSEDYDSILDLL